MRTASYPQSTRFYMLQPGDGTRYVMGLGRLDPGAEHVHSGVGQSAAQAQSYCLLVILMGGGGAAVLPHWDLKEPSAHSIGYAQGHGMSAVNTYTLAACMLAASVLLDNPTDIDGAQAAMLRAPELLS